MRYLPFWARSCAGVTFFFLLVAAAAASSSACFFFCIAVSGLRAPVISGTMCAIATKHHDVPWTIFSSSWRCCGGERPRLGGVLEVACERRANVKVALGAMSRSVWWGVAGSKRRCEARLDGGLEAKALAEEQVAEEAVEEEEKSQVDKSSLHAPPEVEG